MSDPAYCFLFTFFSESFSPTPTVTAREQIDGELEDRQIFEHRPDSSGVFVLGVFSLLL